MAMSGSADIVKPQSMKLPSLLTLAFLLLSTCHRENPEDFSLPFYTDQSLGPAWIDPGSPGSTNLHRIGDFRLTTQTGAAFTEKNLDGKINVAFFFFTHCAGICPKVVGNVKKVTEVFPDPERLTVTAFSVTPEMDSPAVLGGFAKDRGLGASWQLLTGNRTTIYSLARESFFAGDDLGKPVGPDDFLHSENVYLLDANRRIRGLYKGTFEPDILRLIEDVKLLEKEGLPHSPKT